MFENLEKSFKEIERLTKKQTILGNLTTRVCFDRKKPIIILSDGIGEINISGEQLEAACKHYIYGQGQNDTPRLVY